MHLKHLKHLAHLRRLRIALAITATAAVAGVGLAVAHPWQGPPPVLRPAGLILDSSTTSSAGLSWSGPATGPLPDRYEIVRDGHVVGTVPGNTTHYRDTGLAPDTAYQYEVIALRDTKQSPESVVLSVMTLTPPVSGPVGTWNEAYSSDPTDVNGQYSITESDGLYTMTAKTVLELPDGNCSLPAGTEEGTFSASGPGTYSGTQKVWYTGTCAYAYMSPFTATLSGNTMIMQVANAEPESFTLTRAGNTPTAPASSSAPGAVASPALAPQRQAAQALAALLAQSGTDRAAVTQAPSAVADCSPGLSQDETIFSNAASSRQALLGELAALPDRSALPASMLQDLTTAWQASGEADQDFAELDARRDLARMQHELPVRCQLPGRNGAG